jgi:dipeptide transport system permease protein
MTNATQTPPTAPMPPAPAARKGNPRWAGLREFWYYFSVNRGAVIGLWVFVITVFIAIIAPLIAPFPPEQIFSDAILKPPGADPRFVFGTDAVGRDIFSRLVHGARFSLAIGLVVVTIAMISGVTLGVIAGYFRGPVDAFIMRVMDIILAFPSLLLALVLVSILGKGLFNAMLAIALVLQPHFARLARAAVMSEKTREYVTSAKVAGAGHLRLMIVTILPNCLGPLIVQGTLSFSNAILEAAALGFLGLGAQPPTPEWGTMLSGSRDLITRAWWVVTLPGLAILITVLAINLVGDGLRDALDPKLKRS